MNLNIRPLTPELWPALEDLFGKHGACNGCWCMYWRIGSQYHNRPREKNKAAFRQIVKRGPPPGLIAFDGDLAVGWCQLTPRSDLDWLNRARLLQPVDDMPVWSVSCFYVRRGYRRRGIASALIAAAIETARQANAPALEVYPIDTNAPRSSSNLFTGTASTFTRAGFKTVARRSPSRPILRYEMKTASKLAGELRVGDFVRIIQIPNGLTDAAGIGTPDVFKRALGKSFRIEGFDLYGHIELIVSRRDTIWIEPEFVVPVWRSSRNK
jgi:GNAT superfamily N-acetyltransferase